MTTAKSHLYYSESGTVSPVGMLTFFGLGLVAAAALGFVYALAVFYVPLVYVSVLLTAGFGFALAYVIGKIAYVAKVRKRSFILLGSLVIGIAGLYFAWVFWLWALSEFSLLSFSPAYVFDMMQLIGITGVWGIGDDSTVSGTMLYIVWAIEAAIIIGAAVILGRAFVTRQPFCEDCSKWTKETLISSRIEPIGDVRNFIERLEEKDFSVLTSLERVPENYARRTKVEISDCEGCDGSAYLTVENIQVSVDDEGKATENVTPFVENLRISHGDFTMLKNWRKDLNQTLKTVA